ncbi:MAG: hypothetical protein JWM10_2716 [Myxococcaceae bacterium]|nr:hypothetical protein [Myxococcaceae bacterium]
MTRETARAQTWLRWPMIFALRPSDASLLGRCTHSFDLHWDYDAAPDVVHRSFLGFVGQEPWSPGFLGVDWLTPPGELDGAVMDEFYAFMAMRVRVIEHALGRRSVVTVERWSLPMATEMVELVELDALPSGKTRLRFRVAYNVPRIFWPFHPLVALAFRRWFLASFRGLDRYLRKYAPAAAPVPPALAPRGDTG